MMKRTATNRLIIVLALAGFTAGCSCGWYRRAEQTCPTDARQIYPACAGEEAVRRCPCGPDTMFYGHKPTCWDNWPAGWDQYQMDHCGPSCQPGIVGYGAHPLDATPIQQRQEPVEAPTPPAEGTPSTSPPGDATQALPEPTSKITNPLDHFSMSGNGGSSSTASVSPSRDLARAHVSLSPLAVIPPPPPASHRRRSLTGESHSQYGYAYREPSARPRSTSPQAALVSQVPVADVLLPAEPLVPTEAPQVADSLPAETQPTQVQQQRVAVVEKPNADKNEPTLAELPTTPTSAAPRVALSQPNLRPTFEGGVAQGTKMTPVAPLASAQAQQQPSVPQVALSELPPEPMPFQVDETATERYATPIVRQPAARELATIGMPVIPQGEPTNTQRPGVLPPAAPEFVAGEILSIAEVTKPRSLEHCQAFLPVDDHALSKHSPLALVPVPTALAAETQVSHLTDFRMHAGDVAGQRESMESQHRLAMMPSIEGSRSKVSKPAGTKLQIPSSVRPDARHADRTKRELQFSPATAP